MHYLYLKKLPSEKSLFFPFLARFLPGALVFLGLFLISFALVPVFSYKLSSSPRFVPLVEPISEETKMEVLGVNEATDFKRPVNWFIKMPNFPPRPTRITHYNLSIPKLGIENAVVQVGGENLEETLIQYEGTAYPGQFGNTVIFGHSVLPAFFNPENYLTIFSTLPTLEKGDEVLINFDGISYKYVVFELVEVEPTDISVLEQRYDDYYLTLITCVPPGTYFRRLAVRTRLAR